MVSIIVPIFNAAQWLEATVASVVAQTDPGWELLLIDDGSTDSLTPALCDALAAADARIHTLHTPNGGVSAARNRGLDIARGEYIAFLDADDLLHPEFVAATRAAARSTGAEIVFGGLNLFRGEFRIRPLGHRVTTALPTAAVEHALYQTGFDNAPWGKIYHRRLWQGLRFAPCRYEDLDIFYRVTLRAGRVALIATPLYGYRQHSASFIHTFSPSRLDALDVTDRMARWIAAHEPLLNRAAADRRFAAHFNALLVIYKYRISNPEAEARCLKVIREQRLKSLTNNRVRLKNRLGALASLIGGRPLLRLLARTPMARYL